MFALLKLSGSAQQPVESRERVWRVDTLVARPAQLSRPGPGQTPAVREHSPVHRRPASVPPPFRLAGQRSGPGLPLPRSRPDPAPKSRRAAGAARPRHSGRASRSPDAFQAKGSIGQARQHAERLLSLRDLHQLRPSHIHLQSWEGDWLAPSRGQNSAHLLGRQRRHAGRRARPLCVGRRDGSAAPPPGIRLTPLT